MESTHPEVLAGAEAQSFSGDRRGALVIHGFTGTTQSMRGLAEAFAADGMSVEMPRLPGHGTSVEDMLTTSWEDWSAHVEATYADLASRTDEMVVVGLSMGGTLATWIATRHPVAALITINGALMPQPEIAEFVTAIEATGEVTMDAVGNDINKDGVVELAYDKTPLAPLRSLGEAVEALQADIPNIGARVLICRSPDDHVVPPESADHFASLLTADVERLELPNSYHVATLDNDAELIETTAVRFANASFNLS